jgi:hypothetical protein
VRWNGREGDPRRCAGLSYDCPTRGGGFSGGVGFSGVAASVLVVVLLVVMVLAQDFRRAVSASAGVSTDCDSDRPLTTFDSRLRVLRSLQSRISSSSIFLSPPHEERIKYRFP